MYNHNKAQQSSNRVHISWDILYISIFAFVALQKRVSLRSILWFHRYSCTFWKHLRSLRYICAALNYFMVPTCTHALGVLIRHRFQSFTHNKLTSGWGRVEFPNLIFTSEDWVDNTIALLLTLLNSQSVLCYMSYSITPFLCHRHHFYYVHNTV